MSNNIKIAVDAMGGDNSPKRLLMELFTIINQIKMFLSKFLVMRRRFQHI